MIRFIGILLVVAVLAVGGYMVWDGKLAKAPVNQAGLSLPKSGNEKIDNVIMALEEEASAEAAVAGEADASADTVTSDSEDLNNLDQSYDSQF